MEQVVEEIHKPARRNYQRRRVKMRRPNETYQADLVEMIPYSRENKGYKYILNIIDIFSKYAYSVPLKSKTGQEVATALESVLKKIQPTTRKTHLVKNIHVDLGKEFYNKNVQELLDRYKINMFSTYSGLKASICERFNRSIKENMWKKFSLQGNYKWVDMLPNLLETYNNRIHRTIGMRPKDVTINHTAEILKRLNKNQVPRKPPKFKVNDKVRLSKNKNLFEKSYTGNWSTEVFTITKVNNTNPVTYLLKDYLDQPVSGCFYSEELQKTKHPDVYLVEKVIKKQGNKLLIKWLGFDESHNSWIDQKDL